MGDKQLQPPRLDPDGVPQVDLLVNPKAVERKEREAAEKAAFAAEAAAPPSRAKIERMIERASKLEPFEINGEKRPQGLNLHGWNLDGLDLSGLDLSHANMHGVSAKGTKFTGANLGHVNGHGGVFEDAEFDDAVSMESFNGCRACFKGASFEGVVARAKDGGDSFAGGLVGANLSESCCHASGSGLDIEEHGLTIEVVDPETQEKILRKVLPEDIHTCLECGLSMVTIKDRIEHTIETGHGKWRMGKNQDLLGQALVDEPVVVDMRLFLSTRNRRPIMKGGRLYSIGPQLRGANVTGMTTAHRDEVPGADLGKPDPDPKPRVIASGMPEEFIL